MNERDMADAIALELIEDIDNFANSLVKFADRFSQYCEQYQHLLSEDRREELDVCFDRFSKRLEDLGEPR